MNEKTWLISAASLLLAVVPLSALAGPCDAYFTFDDTLADASGNGYDGEMIAKGGALSTPSYTDGKFGKALMLDGNAAMRALINLHWNGCPQVTITAWVNVPRGASSDNKRILSTGGGNGPGLTISGTGLILTGAHSGIIQQQAIRQGSWVFVAGVYDYEAGEYFLYGGGGSRTPGKLSEKYYPPQNAMWIGTEHDDWGVFARGVAIDDLRIIGRRLEEPQITALRASQPNNADAATGNTGESVAGGSTQGASTSSACDAQSNCSDGYYCAVDNICYPNSQLPRDYVAAAAPTGGPGRPGLNVSNPNTIPDADDLLGRSGDGATDAGSDGSSPRTGLPNPSSSPIDDLVDDLSASQLMAGRWVHTVDDLPGFPDPGIPGMTFRHTTLDIFGRDNALTGTVSSFEGDIDEALTNISKLGRTIRVSSQNYGSWTGQLAENGRSMYLQSTNTDALTRGFIKVSDTVPSANSAPDPAPEPEDNNDAVQPTGLPRPVGAGVLTGVAGEESKTTRTIDLVNNFLVRISWNENGDRPCKLTIEGDSEAMGNAVRTETLEGCGSGSTLGAVLAGESIVEFPSPPPNSGAVEREIHHLTVCSSNNSNRRLKGLRVFGNGIDASGQRTLFSTSDGTDRSGCDEWRTPKFCDYTRVGSGIVIHYTRASGRNEQIVGLQLICRRIGLGNE